METVAAWVEGLTVKDNTVAYDCLKKLLAESEKSNAVYSHFRTFAAMLGSDNSYLRSRGLLLIAANARWDTDFLMDETIDEYLRHIEDPKPITARQCIQSLAQIAKYKPDLATDIAGALQRANTFRYPGTMQPLIQKDIAEALRQIDALAALQTEQSKQE